MAERILIIRLSAIGDVVFASPLIRAVRARYPDAEISWLVEPAAAPLVSAHPELHEVIVWDKALWKTLWRERKFGALWSAIRSFRAALRARRFDRVFEVQGLFKSAFMAWLTGAGERVGFKGKEKQAWLLTQALDKRSDNRVIGSEYRGFAEDTGLPVADFAMEVALTDDDRALAQAEFELGEYAVICPFTTRPQKHWQDHHWFRLAELIEQRFGLRVLMLGGPGDKNHAHQLADGSTIESRVGSLKLRQSAAVISRASLLVGVDTGLTHMGIAFGVPTVALFGSTCPYRDTRRDNARVIYHQLPCSPCRRHPTCHGRFDCLTGISPDEVYGACASLPGLAV